jgi:hypothetical protein
MSSREDERDASYPNVVRAVAETPWAMVPERFASSARSSRRARAASG